jgi:hypothetical protein
MNPRERLMAIVLGVLIVFGGGGFAFYQFFWKEYQRRLDTVVSLQKKNAEMEVRKQQILAEEPKLRKWEQLSLPPSPKSDPNRTKTEYQKYLEDLIRDSRLAEKNAPEPVKVDAKAVPTLPGRGPIYSVLAYKVTAKGSYANFVRFLEKFYQAGLLQQIRNVKLKRATSTSTAAAPGGGFLPGGGLGAARQPSTDLDIELTVEALVLPGTAERQHVLPNLDLRTLLAEATAALRQQPGALWLAYWTISPAGPLGPGELAQPARDYSAMASRDIFIGPPPASPDAGKPEWIALRLTEFTHYSSDDQRTEAFINDKYNKRPLPFRLCLTSGFDAFPLVKDSQSNTVAWGVLVRIDVDKKELVLRIELTAQDAPRSASKRADQRNGFFRLDLEKLDQFQKERDKINVEEWETLARDQVLRAQYGDQVLRVDRLYWESLVKDKIFIFNESDGRFQLEMMPWVGPPNPAPEDVPIEVLKGKVLRGPGPDWYLVADERYCALRLGQTLESALKKPMTESQVKELKTAAAGGGGGGIAP